VLGRERLLATVIANVTRLAKLVVVGTVTGVLASEDEGIDGLARLTAEVADLGRRFPKRGIAVDRAIAGGIAFPVRVARP
jgi:hypothetical protein